jgi:hypothetical protein
MKVQALDLVPKWRHSAENKVAPLCRNFGGAINVRAEQTVYEFGDLKVPSEI